MKSISSKANHPNLIHKSFSLVCAGAKRWKRLTICALGATAIVTYLVSYSALSGKAKTANHLPAGQMQIEVKTRQQQETVQSPGRSKPYFNFRDGQTMQVEYRGEQSLTQALQSGQAQPRALASTDLDGDAAPDLVAGYSYGGIGILTVQRGNSDAFAPRDESVYVRMHQGYSPNSPADSTNVSDSRSADFLQAGDFNNDSRKTYCGWA